MIAQHIKRNVNIVCIQLLLHFNFLSFRFPSWSNIGNWSVWPTLYWSLWNDPISQIGPVRNEVVSLKAASLAGRNLYIYIYIFLFGPTTPSGSWPPRSRGFYITHNDAPKSVGLLWTSDQLVAETSTWQHTTLTFPRWDSNPRSQQASGRRPTP